MAFTSFSNLTIERNDTLDDLGFDSNLSRPIISEGEDSGSDDVTDAVTTLGGDITDLSESLNPDYTFLTDNTISKGDAFSIYNNGGVATAKNCNTHLTEETINFAEFRETFRDSLNDRVFLLTTTNKLIYISYDGDLCNTSSEITIPSFTGTLVQVKIDETTGRFFILSESGSTFYLRSFTINTTDNKTVESVMASTVVSFNTAPPYGATTIKFNVFNGALAFVYQSIGNTLKSEGGYYSGTTYTHGGNNVQIDSDGSNMTSPSEVFAITKNISGSTTSNFAVSYAYSSSSSAVISLFKVGYTNGTVTLQNARANGSAASPNTIVSCVEKSKNRIVVFIYGTPSPRYYTYNSDGTTLSNGYFAGSGNWTPRSAEYNDSDGSIFLVADDGSTVKTFVSTIDGSDDMILDSSSTLEYYTGRAYEVASSSNIASPQAVYSDSLSKMIYISDITYATIDRVIISQTISSSSGATRTIVDTATYKPMFIAQTDASASSSVSGIPIIEGNIDNSSILIPASEYFFDKFTGLLTASPTDSGQATSIGRSFNETYLYLTVNYYDL